MNEQDRRVHLSPGGRAATLALARLIVEGEVRRGDDSDIRSPYAMVVVNGVRFRALDTSSIEAMALLLLELALSAEGPPA